MSPKRWVSTAAVALLAVSGCSSSGDNAEPVVVGTIEPPPQSSVVTVPVTTDQVELDTTAASSVEMSVEVDSVRLEADLVATIDPTELDAVDPFGEFASCSGTHRSFSTYSVLVSQPGNDVSALSVITAVPVTGPRVYDANVRVEPAVGEAITAAGTVTIGPDLRSGAFLAFEPGGERVEGSFTCIGGDTDSAVLDVSDGAGTLEAVEVVALLRRGGAERVVELAVDTTRSPEVTVECAAAVGGSAPLLVRVDGDQSVGPVSTFELTDGGSPTLRLRVGGTSLEFDDVSVTSTDPAVAGTFSASSGGTAVDGAYRCT